MVLEVSKRDSCWLLRVLMARMVSLKGPTTAVHALWFAFPIETGVSTWGDAS